MTFIFTSILNDNEEQINQELLTTKVMDLKVFQAF